MTELIMSAMFQKSFLIEWIH